MKFTVLEVEDDSLSSTSIPQFDSSVIVNSKISELRQDIDNNVFEIEKWLNSLLIQTNEDAQIKKDRCEICLSKEDPTSLELHHIAGRKHDYRTISACLACHRVLSDWQKIWDKRWLRVNQGMNIRNAFFLMGLYDILTLKGEKTGNSAYKILANKLIESISFLLR